MQLKSVLAMAVVLAVATAGPLPALGIGTAERREVVEALATNFAELYADADTGARVRDALLDALGAGRFDGAATPEELAEQLSDFVKTASGDRHASVRHSRTLVDTGGGLVQRRNMGRPGTGRLVEDTTMFNHGFTRVERLAGNVGYLRFDRFARPDAAATAMGAAMALLGGTDALILDLRQNGGGYAGATAAIAGHFVEKPVHLATTTMRATGERIETWIRPPADKPVYIGKPVFILTSDRTASASEVLSFHLQALGVATVVGEATYGVANPVRKFGLPHDFAANIPVGRTVNHTRDGSWHDQGVQPDIRVDEAEAQRAAHLLALDAIAAADPGKAEAVAQVRAEVAAP